MIFTLSPLKIYWLMVKITSLLTRHGLDGNSLEQGEEGAISLLFVALPPLK